MGSRRSPHAINRRLLGLLKRGVIGTFHQLSIKHLDRYIQEFSYRWNERSNQDMFAITVACLVRDTASLRQLVGENRIVRNVNGVNQYSAKPAADAPADPYEPF